MSVDAVLKRKIDRAAHDADIHPAWLHAIIQQESGYNPNAYNPEDGKDPSYGLAQLRLSTARQYGFTGEPEKLFEIDTHLEYVRKHLVWLTGQLARAKPDWGFQDLAAAWNAGIGRWREHHVGGRPLPASTRLYVLEASAKALTYAASEHVAAFYPLLIPALTLLGLKIMRTTKTDGQPGGRPRQTGV